MDIRDINRVLARESSSKVQKDYRNIEKKNRQFILVKSLSPLIDDFSTKRITCKGHSDAVTSSLTNFLNEKRVRNRTDYIQAEAERLLLSFIREDPLSFLLMIFGNLQQEVMKLIFLSLGLY